MPLGQTATGYLWKSSGLKACPTSGPPIVISNWPNSSVALCTCVRERFGRKSSLSRIQSVHNILGGILGAFRAPLTPCALLPGLLLCRPGPSKLAKRHSHVSWLHARLEGIRKTSESVRRLPPRKLRKPSGRRSQGIFTKLIPLDVLGQIQDCCMTELDEIFVDLGLSQYLEVFIEHGFDTWETILDITESDL